MELDALPKDEGVGQAVVGDLVAFGNCRLEIAVGVGLDQALVDVEKDLSSPCRYQLIRVKAVSKILWDTHHQLAAGNRLPGSACIVGAEPAFLCVFRLATGGQYRDGKESRQEKCENAFFAHWNFSFRRRSPSGVSTNLATPIIKLSACSVTSFPGKCKGFFRKTNSFSPNFARRTPSRPAAARNKIAFLHTLSLSLQKILKKLTPSFGQNARPFLRFRQQSG